MKYSVFYHHICEAAKERGCTVEEMMDVVRSWGIEYLELDRDVIGKDDESILAFARHMSTMVWRRRASTASTPGKRKARSLRRMIC